MPDGTSSGDPALWLSENREFHQALCEPCGKPRLIAAINALVLAGDRYVMLVAADRPLGGEAGRDPSQIQHARSYPALMRAKHRAIVADVDAGRTAAALRALKADILGAGPGVASEVRECERARPAECDRATASDDGRPPAGSRDRELPVTCANSPN